MDISLPDQHVDDIVNPPVPPRTLKDYLIGPRTNILLPVHGWTSTSVLFNHLEENVAKVLGKPGVSLY
jgi:hypothetical protein